MAIRLEHIADGENIPESLLNMISECFAEPPITFPPEMIKSIVSAGRAVFYSALSGEDTVGFGITIPEGESVYVFLLGVDSDARGQGYGKEILNELRILYSDRNLILDCEENNRKFYERCGMAYSGYSNLFLGVRFFIMTYGSLNLEDYGNIMQVIMHHDDTILMDCPDGTSYGICWNPVNR